MLTFDLIEPIKSGVVRLELLITSSTAPCSSGSPNGVPVPYILHQIECLSIYVHESTHMSFEVASFCKVKTRVAVGRLDESRLRLRAGHGNTLCVTCVRTSDQNAFAFSVEKRRNGERRTVLINACSLDDCTNRIAVP